MAEVRYLSVDGARSLAERRVAEAQPGPGRVAVDVSYVGICGTDVHGYTDGSMLPPAVFGHEWTGVVRAVGDGVTAVSAGDRVIGAVGPACGRCLQCVAGNARQCDTAFAEANGVDPDAAPYGAFATRVEVAERRVLRVLDSLTDEQAALIEPTAVTFHAVRRACVVPGRTAVVIGAGAIGLLTAQHVRNAGAGQVIISEPSADRRKVATELGFDSVVAPDEVTDRVQQQTGGVGADFVFECAGVAALFQSSAELVRRGGTLSLLGFPMTESTVSYADWQTRELTVIGSLAYNHDDFVGAMRVVAAGRVDVTSLHTATIGLDDLRAMLDELDSGDSRQTKVLVDPRR